MLKSLWQAICGCWDNLIVATFNEIKSWFIKE